MEYQIAYANKKHSNHRTEYGAAKELNKRIVECDTEITLTITSDRKTYSICGHRLVTARQIRTRAFGTQL